MSFGLDVGRGQTGVTRPIELEVARKFQARPVASRRNAVARQLIPKPDLGVVASLNEDGRWYPKLELHRGSRPFDRGLLPLGQCLKIRGKR